MATKSGAWGEPTFILHHTLENIGTRTIDIDHYNHNFTRIDVLKPLGDASLWIRLRGAGGVTDNACTITNRKTGAAVSFTGNVPITEFRFWAVETAACPEPFIRLEIAPGKAAEWTREYALSVDGEGP